jgi:hypothetical protein
VFEVLGRSGKEAYAGTRMSMVHVDAAVRMAGSGEALAVPSQYIANPCRLSLPLTH